MKKNVSLLVSAAGWIGGLVDKLVIALRERGVTDEEIHALVNENGSALIGKIADAIAEFVKQTKKNGYVISVNYDISIEELIKRGKYDWSDKIITNKNFLTKRSGKSDIAIELVHFNRKMFSSEIVLSELDKIGLRPAEACELLTFGEKYPDLQLNFPIVALGFGSEENAYPLFVISLAGRGDVDRIAFVRLFLTYWGPQWRFAAVRKS
jgi:hypothetical protein